MLDLIAHLDVLDWLDRRFGVWFHRRWKRRLHEAGLAGILGEVAIAASGQAAWRFHIPRQGEWSGWEAEKLLKRYGVRIWGRGFDADSVYFSVKAEQANWAEYLLKRRGIAVSSRPFNDANDLYASWYAPGDEPPQRR